MSAIQPIEKVSAYFGGQEIPTITAEFRPGTGWVTMTYRKRVSRAWVRKLRARGVSHVALSLDGRTAEFSTDELLRAT